MAFWLKPTTAALSLNYIKQLGLKDNLPLTLHQTMEVLHPYEYAILSVRVGVWEVLCQVGLQIDLVASVMKGIM